MSWQCTTKGCRRQATFEVEIQGPGADCLVYYCCDEHYPPPGVLIWGVDHVRRLLGVGA